MFEQHQYPPNEVTPQGSVWAGFGLSLLLHLFQIPIIILILAIYKGEEQMYALFTLMFIGVSQLLYMVPAIIIAAVKKRPHLVKGLILGASIVFLLNAACTGLIFISL